MVLSTLIQKAWPGRLQRFLKDTSGNMAIVVAISALPLMMAGGAAVDYGNWVSVEARLQAAVDAAALAVGREINKTDAELETIALNYFRANFGEPRNTGTPEVTLSLDSGKARVDAKVDVENYLMKAVGKESQTVATYAEVSKEATNLDVVLVFDNTGSMAQESRLSTLKVAAHDFVQILFGPNETASTLKVGVVPFSQFVNVGPDKAGASWLDTGGLNPYSNDNFDATSSGYHNWLAWQDLRNRSWTGCVEARTGDLAVNDTEPDTSNGETLFPPAFAPDEPDSGSYRNNYLSDRSTSGYVLQQENYRKYRNASVSSSSRGPDKGCNIQPIQALTDHKSPVLATINNMRADGYTHVAEGVAWGLRVLSPGEPFTEGRPYSNETTKAMVLLTDGENTFESISNHNRSTYTAYGYLGQRRLGSDSYWTAIGKQNDMLRAACNNVKAEDIVVYSFAYRVDSATQRNLIRDCASDPEKYFDPPSNEALVQNFQQIADELRRLHLSK
jgi:Flp pilus assembly protein TadG